MGNGMEMMVRSLLGAMGVNPDEIKAVVIQQVQQFQSGLASMDTSFKALLARQDEINARLERLELHLGVNAKATDESDNVTNLKRVTHQ